MDKIKKTIYLLLTAAVTYSCQTESQYSRELEQVDSLQQVVEDYRASFDFLDSEKIKDLSVKVDSQLRFISAHHPDTGKREFWTNEMSHLAVVMKSLNRYEENYDELNKNITFTGRQLQTLKNSLRDEQLGEGEELSQEQANKYLGEEAQAVKRLEFQYTRVMPETRRALTIWDSLGPRYDSIVEHVRGLRK